VPYCPRAGHSPLIDRWLQAIPLADVLILRERSPGECRVAATPETVRRLRARGLDVRVQKGAGLAAGYSDGDFSEAGAQLVEPEANFGGEIDAVLCVNPPAAELLDQLKPGTLVAGLLSPYGAVDLVEQLLARRVSALALELLPRISRAQSMDVLSSQANIAGYKAVLLAAAALDRYVPMLMTAAGTIQPARALILGAGGCWSAGHSPSSWSGGLRQ
jgi:H+-translocating NAD(P) transhydrogenase subunit alpha